MKKKIALAMSLILGFCVSTPVWGKELVKRDSNIIELEIEAESGNTNGSVKVESGFSWASGQKKVGWFKDNESNNLILKANNIPEDYLYDMDIVFESGETRHLCYKVNNGEKKVIYPLNSGAWNKPSVQQEKIELKKGENEIKFFADSSLGYGQHGANIDKIILRREMSIRMQLKVKIDEAQELLNNSIVGDNQGEYPENAVEKLKQDINSAKSVYNNENTDDSKYQEAINALILGITTFKSSVNRGDSKPNPSENEGYRLIFEEFLMLQIGLFLFKGGINEKYGIKFQKETKLDEILNSLPFKLTNAQNRALNEIINDMESEKVMNRLVQGDVGSGKTVVALLSLANCVLNGYQGALMAPTEILAEQHFISLNETLSLFGINVGLLVGSMTKKQKDNMLKKIKDNEIDILIGTHALIEDKVEFNNLGLVITDEQHRFGVRQRNKLSEKGYNPDILVMTATPIPRTLALILYGDLDISIIDELPPGRQPIETVSFYKDKRDKAYNSLVRPEIEKGRQVYIVCPLVEESEAIEAKAAVELVEELKCEFFSDLRLGLLHGKMKPSEKDEVMKKFKNKELDILVSTTVIEVGVNVPNATLMIIENAERFGLAQLHQLRGRVGRGSHKSHCVLIYSSKSEVCLQRMYIMEETTDGFKISEKDLEIRGPGEFFGTRQHGLPELKVANIFKHMKILKVVQQEARNILKNDSNLRNEQNLRLKREIFKKFENRLNEISLN